MGRKNKISNAKTWIKKIETDVLDFILLLICTVVIAARFHRQRVRRRHYLGGITPPCVTHDILLGVSDRFWRSNNPQYECIIKIHLSQNPLRLLQFARLYPTDIEGVLMMLSLNPDDLS